MALPGTDLSRLPGSTQGQSSYPKESLACKLPVKGVIPKRGMCAIFGNELQLHILQKAQKVTPVPYIPHSFSNWNSRRRPQQRHIKWKILKSVKKYY